MTRFPRFWKTPRRTHISQEPLRALQESQVMRDVKLALASFGVGLVGGFLIGLLV